METHIWEKLSRKGYYVPERDFHTATAVEGPRNRKLVVFGGRSKSDILVYYQGRGEGPKSNALCRFQSSEFSLSLSLSPFHAHTGDKFYPYFTANDTYDDRFYSFNLGMDTLAEN